ncbi:MAG: histidine kinase, partial [Chloroflexi bacterium]
DLSRVNRQGRPFEKVDLAEITTEAVSDLEMQIQRTKGAVVIETLPTIEADPVQIHQVLLNLIGNALKFHQPEVPPLVRVSSKVLKSPGPKGDMVSIEVHDNGIGFEEEHFERILQPFQRLHGRSEYEGTGIGLAIVNKIIERHHGQISARSVPGEGSTFTIILPVKHGG